MKQKKDLPLTRILLSQLIPRGSSKFRSNSTNRPVFKVLVPIYEKSNTNMIHIHNFWLTFQFLEPPLETMDPHITVFAKC